MCQPLEEPTKFPIFASIDQTPKHARQLSTYIRILRSDFRAQLLMSYVLSGWQRIAGSIGLLTCALLVVRGYQGALSVPPTALGFTSFAVGTGLLGAVSYWLTRTAQSVALAVWQPLGLVTAPRIAVPGVTVPRSQPVRKPSTKLNRPASRPGENWSQQLRRVRSPAGVDQLCASVREVLIAGQRQATVHVAFCPPFAAPPRLEIESITARGVERSAVRVQPGQVLAQGVRLEIKLAVVGPAEVRIAFTATDHDSPTTERS